jgi:uncharacterized SAM-dependent methyltransferase
VNVAQVFLLGCARIDLGPGSCEEAGRLSVVDRLLRAGGGARARHSRIQVLCQRDGNPILGLRPVKGRAGMEAACDDPVRATAAFSLDILD